MSDHQTDTSSSSKTDTSSSSTSASHESSLPALPQTASVGLSQRFGDGGMVPSTATAADVDAANANDRLPPSHYGVPYSRGTTAGLPDGDVGNLGSETFRNPGDPRRYASVIDGHITVEHTPDAKRTGHLEAEHAVRDQPAVPKHDQPAVPKHDQPAVPKHDQPVEPKHADVKRDTDKIDGSSEHSSDQPVPRQDSGPISSQAEAPVRVQANDEIKSNDHGQGANHGVGIFETADAIVNPKGGFAKGVMDNLDTRGEALVHAPENIVKVYMDEGAVGVVGGLANGVVHLVTDTPQAAFDVGFYGVKAIVDGDDEAKQTFASRSLDLVLNAADIVLLVDGVGAAKTGGTEVAKGVAVAATKEIAATAEGAEALSNGGALASAVGAVDAGETALAATGKTAIQGGNELAAGPRFTRLPSVPEPEGLTAQPKLNTPPSTRDQAILGNKGMSRQLRAYPRDPLHHVIPRELLEYPAIKALLERRKFDIDRLAVSMSEGEHTAIHSMNYNKRWFDFFANNENASRRRILNFAQQMRREYKISGPYTRYTK